MLPVTYTYFQLIVCTSCVTEPQFCSIAASEFSMGKQAVTHRLDTVYEYYTAGSRLIIGLARTFIYREKICH